MTSFAVRWTFTTCRARPHPQGVENVRDEEALIPLVAHVEYWKNLTLWKQLWAEVHADHFRLRALFQPLRRLVGSGHYAKCDADPVPAIDGDDSQRKVRYFLLTEMAACSPHTGRSGTCPSLTLVTASAQASAARSRPV